MAIGLDVMGDLIDAEVTDVAGPKGRHDTDRAVYRHGIEAGRVTLCGRRIPVRRTYSQLGKHDIDESHIVGIEQQL